MEYICSDTNVWLDFSAVGRTHLPFRLPYTYIMNSDAIEDEVLSPEGLGRELVELGLQPVDITIEEFLYAEDRGCLKAWLDQQTYGRRLPKNELLERLRGLEYRNS